MCYNSSQINFQEKTLVTFFSATQTAANALYADFKFKPYYDVNFHLATISSFICHILRALCDLTRTVLRVVITPLILLNPLAWLSIPDHAMNLIDDIAGFAVSLLTVVIYPLIVTIRTVMSMGLGYQKDSEYDCDIDDEYDDLSRSRAIL